jgi:diacylglycerol kinase family enzyme
VRLTVLHNPKAGSGQGPDRKALLGIIREAGHDADYKSLKEKGWDEGLSEAGDAVIVAGGDGALGKVAKKLAGRGVPIAVIPTGTANNVATALGLAGVPFAQLAAGWASARRVPFDLGTVRGPWGDADFLESVGIGLFAQTMAALDAGDLPEPSREVVGDQLAFGRRLLWERVANCPATSLSITLDGLDLSGEFVLVEALNTPFFGPNLALTPRGDSDDGLLDLVLVRDDERDALRELLQPRPVAGNTGMGLTVHQGKQLRIEGDGIDIHVDDNPRPFGKVEWPNGSVLEVTIRRQALLFLVPTLKSCGD